jgi:hypothetical protein
MLQLLRRKLSPRFAAESAGELPCSFPFAASFRHSTSREFFPTGHKAALAMVILAPTLTRNSITERVNS